MDTAEGAISYGEYFHGAKSFLEKDHFKIIIDAVFHSATCDITPEKIQEICICLEKHGQFYHPAKIEIITHEAIFTFALNVAISDVGKHCIKREYNVLEKLNNDFSFSFIPKVYGAGEIVDANNDLKMCMFLGEWFENFNEFHLSWDSKNKKNKIIVWDAKQGNFFLPSKYAMEIYKQTAMILTCYYSVKTFEQIFPWHHAAGDFVVKICDDKLELKLITVRQYSSMLENDGENDLTLEAALMFFLNLSIRMRLDRLDGVGSIAWADKIAVQGTLDGFFDGLKLKSANNEIDDSLSQRFKNYFSSFTEIQLYDLLKNIVNAYNPAAPEISVIKRSIKQHANELYEAICACKK